MIIAMNMVIIDYRKSSNKPPGGLLNFEHSDLERGGGYLQFFDRQRQNYTMSMDFEMLRALLTTMNYCVI